MERNEELEAAGYHAQVAVAADSSLLFLIDDKTGARVALKRTAPSAAEPQGLWQAGRHSFSTAELIGILDAEPERISPSALLRPVFQDFLLSTSLIIGGPAEIAYFASLPCSSIKSSAASLPPSRASPAPWSSRPSATCCASTSSASTASSRKRRTRWHSFLPPLHAVEGKQKLAARQRPRRRARPAVGLDEPA